MTPDTELALQALARTVAAVMGTWGTFGLLGGLVLGVIVAVLAARAGWLAGRPAASRLLDVLMGVMLVGMLGVYGLGMGLLVGLERSSALVQGDPVVRREIIDPTLQRVSWEGLVLVAASPGSTAEEAAVRASSWRGAGAIPMVELEAAVNRWAATGTSPEALAAMMATLTEIAAKGGQQVQPMSGLELSRMSRVMALFQVPEAMQAVWTGRTGYAGRDGVPDSVSAPELGAMVADGVVLPGLSQVAVRVLWVGGTAATLILALAVAAVLGVARLLRGRSAAGLPSSEVG